MIWPTAEQERLLLAALALPAEARAACGALHGIDLCRLDEPSRRLLPLLCANLRALDVRGPLRDEVEREYRYTANRNAALFDRGRGLIADLNTAGVTPLVLKGAALVGRYYGDPGLRPMADLDVLIPLESFFQALAVFQRGGWIPRYVLTSSFIRTKHGAPFSTTGGFTCDVHWRVFEGATPPGADDALWAASTQVDFYGAESRALCAADQLLHVCVHGARWAPAPAVWWISDAIAIIRAGGLDWDRLVSQSVTYRFVLRLREALGYLRNRFGAAVPADVLGALQALPISALERVEWRVISREHRVLGELPAHWCRHLRSVDGGGMRGLLAFPRYLRDVWGEKSIADLPRASLGRAVVRAADALRRLQGRQARFHARRSRRLSMPHEGA